MPRKIITLIIEGYSMQSILPDFDVLATMAQTDPAGLEALRQRLCEELIASAPPHMQRRLRGLQFQIDAQRRLAKTPLQACLKISEMMHDSFAELRAALNQLAGEEQPVLTRERRTPTGRILNFRGVDRRAQTSN
jgi:hypothetical protein